MKSVSLTFRIGKLQIKIILTTFKGFLFLLDIFDIYVWLNEFLHICGSIVREESSQVLQKRVCSQK
jgi:hypothetical protein